jgi:DNA polymerase-3 subunit epsilon/exodeoxyribonuclease X
MKTLAELTKTPIFIKDFKFGKYKGRSIEEIYEEDKGYINWFINSMEHDIDMKYTLNKIIGNITSNREICILLMLKMLKRWMMQKN